MTVKETNIRRLISCAIMACMGVVVLANDPQDQVEFRQVKFTGSNTTETFTACSADCVFLLNFGDKSVIVSKNHRGEVLSAQIVPRSFELDSQMVAVDVNDLVDNIRDHPFVHVGEHLFGFFQLNDGESFVAKGSEGNNQSRNSNRTRRLSSNHAWVTTWDPSSGGPDTPTSEPTKPNTPICTTNRVIEDETCKDQGTSYFIQWNECDRTVCTDRTVVTKNCESKEITVPKEVINRLGLWTPTKACT